MTQVVVGIPSFNRPQILKVTLKNLTSVPKIGKIVVVADATSLELLKEYEKLAQTYSSKVVLVKHFGSRGYTKAWNVALRAIRAKTSLKREDIVILMDDDHILNSQSVDIILDDFNKISRLHVVSGKVINKAKRAVDSEFFLNVSPSVVERIVDLTGFIFINNKHGPRLTCYTTAFMAVRAAIIQRNEFEFDENYIGTGYRGESDVQIALYRKGYKILYDPRIVVFHLVANFGGCRDVGAMSRRLYYKACNHTYFVYKNFKDSIARRMAYTLIGALLLLVYAPQAFGSVLGGVKDGLMSAQA